jgi:hypothetical protein
MAEQVAVLQAGRCSYCGEVARPRIFHAPGCPYEIPGAATQLLGGTRGGSAPWQQGMLPIHLPAPRVAGNVRSIAERYRAGESIRSLAAAEGVSYGTIRNRLREAGVALQRRSPAAEARRRTAAA